jgi:tRNA(Arg) A34 adenosine deaminase TadA
VSTQTSDPRLTPTEARALQGAIDRALEAAASPGRTGIAAAIVAGERILEVAENVVHSASDPTKHAEMVAIAALTQREDREDLGDCVLISTLQPCEMCLSAMRFVGIRRLIFAARQESVAGKYFVFPRLRIADFAAAGEAFEHIGGVGEAAVLSLYKDGQE